MIQTKFDDMRTFVIQCPKHPVPGDMSRYTVTSRKCLPTVFSIKNIRKDKTTGILSLFPLFSFLHQCSPVVSRLLESGLCHGTAQRTDGFGLFFAEDGHDGMQYMILTLDNVEIKSDCMYMKFL